MAELARVLDRICETPSFLRRLKGQSGSFKIKSEGRDVVVKYSRAPAGYFTFEADTDEATILQPGRDHAAR